MAATAPESVRPSHHTIIPTTFMPHAPCLTPKHHAPPLLAPQRIAPHKPKCPSKITPPCGQANFLARLARANEPSLGPAIYAQRGCALYCLSPGLPKWHLGPPGPRRYPRPYLAPRTCPQSAHGVPQHGHEARTHAPAPPHTADPWPLCSPLIPTAHSSHPTRPTPPHGTPSTIHYAQATPPDSARPQVPAVATPRLPSTPWPLLPAPCKHLRYCRRAGLNFWSPRLPAPPQTPPTCPRDGAARSPSHSPACPCPSHPSCNRCM